MASARQVALEVAGREVVITNPDKVFFPQSGHTKLDLARYYAAVADGALRGIAGRPIVLKRYVDGAEGEPFFQKRAPEQHPGWVETVRSEEHTSELQSRLHLVCRLLLEKKKKNSKERIAASDSDSHPKPQARGAT